jgi:ABC-type transporter Mla MlaB component
VVEPFENSADATSGFPPAGPCTGVVLIDGPLSRDRIATLCSEARRLLTSGRVDVVVCDVGALIEPDVMVIEALARLQLTARRAGGSIGLRRASGSLRDLLALVGLCDVVAWCDDSPLGSRRQLEEGEQPRVEEGVEGGDPAG